MSATKRRTIRQGGAFLAIALVATACTTTSSEPGGSPPQSVAPESTIPDTPVGAEAQWVLETLEADSGPSAQQAEERFTDAFLAQVPADQVPVSFNQLRPLGPFAVEWYEGAETGAEVGLIGSDDSRWRMSIALDDEGRIDLLAVQPHEDPPDVTSWQELDAALAESGADVSVYAARHRGGTWDVIHERGAGEPAPLGSVFKLYVLGAVQQAVLEGGVAWDDQLTVTDELRSLPTGELQDQPSGTTVTVAEAAEKMISISDNTATDMLIDLVGRPAVEEAVAEMGHHDPKAMQPLLTTRELFRLGWTDPALRDRYAGADTEARRQLLGELPGGLLEMNEVSVTEAVWAHGIDWFATGSDVARAHLRLQDMAAEDPGGTVREVMSINPGVATDGWPYVGFKGGSGPGVLALSWYVEDAAGIPHSLVIQLAADDPTATADVGYVSDLAAQGIALLGEE